MAKSNSGRKGLILFYVSTSQSWSREVGAGRQTEQELGVRSWCGDHGGVLLTSLLLIACSACFQNHLPRHGPARSELGPPTSTVNQENTHRLVHRSFWQGISSVKLPASQRTCVKLTYNWLAQPSKCWDGRCMLPCLAFLIWVWGMEIRSLCVQRKIFTDLAISLYLLCLIVLTLHHTQDYF